MRRRGQWSGVPLTLRTAVLDVPLTVDVAEGLNWAEGAEEVVQTQLLRLRCLRRYVRRQGIQLYARGRGERHGLLVQQCWRGGRPSCVSRVKDTRRLALVQRQALFSQHSPRDRFVH
jgi:hypothetical protein